MKYVHRDSVSMHTLNIYVKYFCVVMCLIKWAKTQLQKRLEEKLANLVKGISNI